MFYTHTALIFCNNVFSSKLNDMLIAWSHVYVENIRTQLLTILRNANEYAFIFVGTINYGCVVSHFKIVENIAQDTNISLMCQLPFLPFEQLVLPR